MIVPHVKVEQRQIDGMVSGLRWVSSPPFVSKAFALDKIRNRILAFIRSIFPVSDAKWGHRRHLVTGFRGYEFVRGNEVGVTIQHVSIKDERTRTILASLETGSRGYYMRPTGFGKGSGPGLFTFVPGDQRGQRHRARGDTADFATKSRIHIPSRAGLHILQRATAFAEQLMLEAKPEFFKKIREEMKKRQVK